MLLKSLVGLGKSLDRGKSGLEGSISPFNVPFVFSSSSSGSLLDFAALSLQQRTSRAEGGYDEPDAEQAMAAARAEFRDRGP